ncbi:uncharacterized protein MONOS_3771 [Monocercomonoides exilis]|uniref:uncharacterized protein n=1 Tax=Monocercomonoides exilis TaxID=2049356 RepID=UPI00355A5C3A|nr:hypothetical protein MONOS_3771 [Monocercomonoides exilis]|eukprot:MONOS_3771.1-p1 / transcript=MONOS_3771.1 / gene=MONOS_3771 / organism=Monocercomonoides_exilis_PA203 / gene_product=unspecified product / transcript_product=unspecified product / location=Mono_scaffold00092:27793-29151(-) / protein_length=453 / sequence_SO=supercontig / SO=protein_coding / is_pseudo=false
MRVKIYCYREKRTSSIMQQSTFLFIATVLVLTQEIENSGLTEVYVRQSGGARNDGSSVDQAVNSFSNALSKLNQEGDSLTIKVIKDATPLDAEVISFDKTKITIGGFKSDGKDNEEVKINCEVPGNTMSLLECKNTVEYEYLEFIFPMSNPSWAFLIYAPEGSSSLSINNCRFERSAFQSQRIDQIKHLHNTPKVHALVVVDTGKVYIENVTCTDEYNTVLFSACPFYISGASEVSLNGVDIKKVNLEIRGAIYISDRESQPANITIDGLTVNEAKSEDGETAGVEMWVRSNVSVVSIGRKRKCTFKSCTAPNGKSGALFIDLPKAASQLQLPSANNLEIDSSNTANSSVTSLFIIAPDIEEFCNQDNAFEFANDYNDSNAGWIKAAADSKSEPIDIVEKYVKKHNNPKNDPATEDKKKSNVGLIVAIVVPIVVVIAIAIVVIVIVVKKRRS